MVDVSESVVVPENNLYKPLEPQRIRLLTLHPSDEQDGEIHGDLATVLLGGEPEFEAISYVWGDISETVPVWISGRQVNITRNLHSALRCLRTIERRVLWADQICINQDDLAERNKQVRVMDAVYSNAAGVHVWLGDSHEWTETSIRIMDDVHADKTFDEIIDLGNGKGITPYAFLMGIWTIVNRPWFERLWVLQEHWLARTCVFHCGDFVINDLAMTQTFFATMMQHVHLTGIMGKAGLYNEFSALVVHLGINFGSWFKPDLTKIGSEEARILHFAISQRCSDSKDRVFGLMGVLPWLKEIAIDYNTPMLEFSGKVTVAAMLRLGSIDNILGMASKMNKLPHRSSSTGLASWMLDFEGGESGVHVEMVEENLTHYHDRMPRSIGRFFDAHSDTPVVVDVINSETIRLPGLQIGVVDKVGPRWKGLHHVLDQSSSEYRESRHQWNLHEDHRKGQTRAWRKFFGGVSEEALWSIILMDLIPGDLPMLPRRLNAEDHAKIHGEYQQYQAKKKRNLTSVFGEDTVDAFNQDPVNMRPFKTHNGYAGSTPKGLEAEPGDVVFALSGCRMPYLLRPAVNRGKEYYTLVANCYVHGIMDGEAVQGTVKKDSKVNSTSRFRSITRDVKRLLQDKALPSEAEPEDEPAIFKDIYLV